MGSTVSFLRAHRVDGLALATLASRSSAPFLNMAFQRGSHCEPSSERRLLVVLAEVFVRFHNKLSAPPVSDETLREHFRDLEIPEDAISFHEIVGQGGYGQVHKARWMNVDVAAKAFHTYRGGQNGRVAREFYSEVKVLRRLRHPNITLLLGMCLKPQYIIVTEYLPRGSLFDLLHRERHMSEWNLSRLVGIACEICHGMVYLHSHGVLHCDLKSSNILLNTLQEVKICDFGLAHLLEGVLEDDTSVNIGCVGTHHWMAPEVLRGDAYSKAADVYSFGMIMWEMLTRKVPFYGYTAAQVIGLVGYGRRRPKVPRGCPEPLRAVLHMALRPSGHTRRQFQDIQEELGRLHHSAVISVEESLRTFFQG